MVCLAWFWRPSLAMLDLLISEKSFFFVVMVDCFCVAKFDIFLSLTLTIFSSKYLESNDFDEVDLFSSS